MAKDADLTQQYPALVIGPPFGGVKEQGPGVYANELAQRGFVVLAFDPSYHGYSGGEPRMTGEARQEMLTMASEQRWENFGKDEAAWRVSYPEEPTEEIPDGRCFLWQEKMLIPVPTARMLTQLLRNRKNFILYQMPIMWICMIRWIKSHLISWRAFLRNLCKRQEQKKAGENRNKFRVFPAFLAPLMPPLRKA